MKEFDITVTETLKRTVTVTAENREIAEALVHDQWGNGDHVLDADDFKEVFFTTEAERVAEPMLDVLLIQPHQPPVSVQIVNTLSALQESVNGHIQAVSPFADPVILICGEEAKIQHQPLNRALYNRDGDLADIIAGPFLIAGLGEEDFTSLSPELTAKYHKHFEKPEKFYTLCGQIVVQKEEPPKDKSSIHRAVPSDR